MLKESINHILQQYPLLQSLTIHDLHYIFCPNIPFKKFKKIMKPAIKGTSLKPLPKISIMRKEDIPRLCDWCESYHT